MRPLSKSRLLAFRQCPKRLWLEINEPALKEESANLQARFDQGLQVGELARSLYDPDGRGTTLNPHSEGWDSAFARTKALLGLSAPIFEATFSANGALAMADVLLPANSGRHKAWRLVEVKSSTSVKEYHHDDVAIQTYVARASGVALDSVALAHIDSSWVFPGGGDYRGLLVEVDLTDEAVSRHEEVADWIAKAQALVQQQEEPRISTGPQCSSPFECSFLTHCSSREARPEYPVHWLPRVQSGVLKQHLADLASKDMRDVPDELLNATQLRVKQLTLGGQSYFNADGAMQSLSELGVQTPPLLFLDFETIQFAVPRWAGTRPYQQIPFQFSCHVIEPSVRLSQIEHLDLSGDDPSLPFARALIASCHQQGAILAYNAAFEKSRIRELAERFPVLESGLLAIVDRIVDLLPVARQHFYHPDMQGSWSIKAVLPAMVPELRYGDLQGVQDGSGAQQAYLEAIERGAPEGLRGELRQQLLDYCRLDTYAMVRLWQVMAGRQDLNFSDAN